MRTNLKDTPVQKTYYSVRKPLHTEVKNFIVDLLNEGWIKIIYWFSVLDQKKAYHQIYLYGESQS